MSIRNTVLALAVVPLAICAANPAWAASLNNPIGNPAKGKVARTGYVAGGPAKGTGSFLGGVFNGPNNIARGPAAKGGGNVFGTIFSGPGNIAGRPAAKGKGTGNVLGAVFNGPGNIAGRPAGKGSGNVLGAVFPAPGNTAGGAPAAKGTGVLDGVLNGAGNLAAGVGNALNGAVNLAPRPGSTLNGAANAAGGAAKDISDRKPLPSPTSSDKGGESVAAGKGRGESSSPFPPLTNTYSSASDGSGLPTIAPAEATGQVASETSRACLTKEYPQAGVVLFKDVCTNEWAMNPLERHARSPQVR